MGKRPEFAAFAPKSGSSEPAEIDYTTNLLHPGCVEGIFHNNPNKESYNYDEVGTFPLDALVDGNSSAYSFITSNRISRSGCLATVAVSRRGLRCD